MDQALGEETYQIEGLTDAKSWPCKAAQYVQATTSYLTLMHIKRGMSGER